MNDLKALQTFTFLSLATYHIHGFVDEFGACSVIPYCPALAGTIPFEEKVATVKESAKRAGTDSISSITFRIKQYCTRNIILRFGLWEMNQMEGVYARVVY